MSGTGPREVREAALLVSDVFPPDIGGSAELMFNVYSRLPGIGVRVLAAGGAPGGDDSVLAGGQVSVARDAVPPSQAGFLRPITMRRHLSRCRQILAAARSGATVVHCARALPEGLDAWLSRRAGGPPYVCWTHGEELPIFRRSRELRPLFPRVLAGAAALLANSANTARVLEEAGGPAHLIEVVYPGVDTQRFRPDLPGVGDLRARLAPDDTALILTVGRLTPRKGQDLVLRALAADGAPLPKYRYVIVGTGETDGRLRALAQQLGISDHVHFTGAVPPDELPAYFAAADLFAHPNRIQDDDFEGFGIVFLEAAAAGVPVIAGRTGGAPEAVVQGETGLLVSGADALELRGVFATLLSDPERRRAMGAAGRRRAVERFSWDRAARQVADVHRRVAAADRRVPD